MALLFTLALLLAQAVGNPAVMGPALMGPAQMGTSPGSGWRWPLSPRPAVVRAFDPPDRPWLSGHRGVDLSGRAEQPIFAPQDGVVSFAGWVVDRPVLTVDHGGGLRSSFEPVETELAVGARVARGQPMARVAAAPAHCEAGCLHWGARRGDDYVNPLLLLGDLRPSILLPWRDP